MISNIIRTIARLKLALLIMILFCMMNPSLDKPCQWDQYLGNPGRSAYVDYNGPSSPEILWEVEFRDYTGTPFVSGEKVIVVYRYPSHPYPAYRIASIDLLTGTLDEAVTNVRGISGACPAGDLIIGLSVCWLYRIDPVSGEAVFDIRVSGELWNTCEPHCYPIVLPDKIVLSTSPVVCLSRADYSELWNLKSSLGSIYPEDARTRMIAASSERIHVIVQTEKGARLWTVDSSTGELLWVDDNFGIWEIATDGPTVFGRARENLYALNAETGKLLWEFQTNPILSNVAAGENEVFFTTETMLYAVDKFSGKLKWEKEWKGSYPWTTYVIGAGDIVICSNVYNLSAFSVADGTELWNVHFQDYVDRLRVKPCPAVTEGILIVVGKDPFKSLIAFASDPDLFVRQGDAFLSMNLHEKAINSYRKAAELYERGEDFSKAEEIQETIYKLENQLQTAPPETPSSEIEPKPSIFQLFPLVVLALISISIAGVILAYCCIMRRRVRE